MIIQLKANAGDEGLQELIRTLAEDSIDKTRLDIFSGDTYTMVGIKGDVSKLNQDKYKTMDQVLKVHRISDKFKELSRQFRPTTTTIKLMNGHVVGEDLTLIAGPCAVESREQLFRTAEIVARAGANVLRGGAFKPRDHSQKLPGPGGRRAKAPGRGQGCLRDADHFGDHGRQGHSPVRKNTGWTSGRWAPETA